MNRRARGRFPRGRRAAMTGQPVREPPVPAARPHLPPPAASSSSSITEDWFFASHFLPMARAARELGLEVAVVTRVREHRAAIEATGARVIPLEAERRSLNPMAAGYAAGQLAAILKDEKPDIVHCIALRAILVGGFAAAHGRRPAPGLRADRARLPRRPDRPARAPRAARRAAPGARPRDARRPATCSRTRTTRASSASTRPTSRG